MEESNFEQRLEYSRQELMYLNLPNLLHRILHIQKRINEDNLSIVIEEIKKITNAECENALSYLKD